MTPAAFRSDGVSEMTNNPLNLCPWMLYKAGHWSRCRDARGHQGAHHIGRVIISTQALVALRKAKERTAKVAR